jgi:hypothetical protein
MDLVIIKKIGLILLGIWLIITGIMTTFSLGNPVVSVVLAIVAIITGILILIDR